MYLEHNKSMVLIACAFLGTAGFGDFFFKEDVREQTDDFINQVKVTTKPSANIVDLQTKELTPYVPTHLTTNSDNPFAVKSFVREIGSGDLADESDICQTDDCGDGPPAVHAPYFLEDYSLDQLLMTGTMTSPQRGKVALIQTPDSGVVYAAIGEYIGRNNGLILSISREGMIIREKYRSPQGWQDRMATLPLIRN